MFYLDGFTQSVRTIQSHFWENREEIENHLTHIQPADGWSSEPEREDPPEGLGGLDLIQWKLGQGRKERHSPRKDYWMENKNGLYESEIRGAFLNRLEARNGFQQHVIARFCSIQIVTILIDTLITQTLRGLVLTIGGALTFEGKLVKAGALDLASVAIQLIALPTLAIIGTISPRLAVSLGSHSINKFHKNEKNPFTTSNSYSQAIIGGSLGILSIPLSSLRSLLRIPVFLMDGNLSSTLSSITCVALEPIMNIARMTPQYKEWLTVQESKKEKSIHKGKGLVYELDEKDTPIQDYYKRILQEYGQRNFELIGYKAEEDIFYLFSSIIERLFAGAWENPDD